MPQPTVAISARPLNTPASRAGRGYTSSISLASLRLSRCWPVRSACQCRTACVQTDVVLLQRGEYAPAEASSAFMLAFSTEMTVKPFRPRCRRSRGCCCQSRWARYRAGRIGSLVFLMLMGMFALNTGNIASRAAPSRPCTTTRAARGAILRITRGFSTMRSTISTPGTSVQIRIRQPSPPEPQSRRISNRGKTF